MRLLCPLLYYACSHGLFIFIVAASQECSVREGDHVARVVDLPHKSHLVRASGVSIGNLISVTNLVGIENCGSLCDADFSCLILEVDQKNNHCILGSTFYLDNDFLTADLFEKIVFIKYEKKIAVKFADGADEACLPQEEFDERGDIKDWLTTHASERPVLQSTAPSDDVAVSDNNTRIDGGTTQQSELDLTSSSSAYESPAMSSTSATDGRQLTVDKSGTTEPSTKNPGSSSGVISTTTISSDTHTTEVPVKDNITANLNVTEGLDVGGATSQTTAPSGGANGTLTVTTATGAPTTPTTTGHIEAATANTSTTTTTTTTAASPTTTSMQNNHTHGATANSSPLPPKTTEYDRPTTTTTTTTTTTLRSDNGAADNRTVLSTATTTTDGKKEVNETTVGWSEQTEDTVEHSESSAGVASTTEQVDQTLTPQGTTTTTTENQRETCLKNCVDRKEEEDDVAECEKECRTTYHLDTDKQTASTLDPTTVTTEGFDEQTTTEPTTTATTTTTSRPLGVATSPNSTFICTGNACVCGKNESMRVDCGDNWATGLTLRNGSDGLWVYGSESVRKYQISKDIHFDVRVLCRPTLPSSCGTPVVVRGEYIADLAVCTPPHAFKTGVSITGRNITRLSTRACASDELGVQRCACITAEASALAVVYCA